MIPFPPISTQIEGKPSPLSDADESSHFCGCLEGRRVTAPSDWSVPLFVIALFSGAIGVTAGSTLTGLNKGDRSFNHLLVGSSVLIMMVSLLAICRINKLQTTEETVSSKQQKQLIEKQNLLLEKQTALIVRQEEDLAKYERQTQNLRTSHMIRQQLHHQIQNLDNI